MPMGILIAKPLRGGQRRGIPAAIVGPATEETATTVALSPMPRPVVARIDDAYEVWYSRVVTAAAPNPRHPCRHGAWRVSRRHTGRSNGEEQQSADVYFPVADDVAESRERGAIPR